MANTQWTKDPNHGFIWNSIDHLLIDVIIAVPMKPDENGNIWL